MNRLALTLSLFTLLSACGDSSPEQKIASAKEYISKDDGKSASIELKNALQKNPDIAEARFLLGTVLSKDGKLAQAEIEFRKALSLQYQESKVVPEIARVQLSLGQFKKLVDEFSTKEFKEPAADATLQTMLAAAQGELGKPDAAEAALKSALAADANYAPALMVRARQKASVKDYEGAMNIADSIISREPRNSDVWLLKGDILQYTTGGFSEPLVAYQKSIEINPKFVAGHIAALTVYMNQNKNDDAAKQLLELKKIAPNYSEINYIEAKLAYQQKNYKLSKEITDKLLRTASNNSRYLQLAGAVELQFNSLEQAEIYLVRANKSSNADPLTQRMLILTYLRSGKTGEAIEVLKEMAGNEDSDLPPHMFLLAGEAYLQSGDAQTALKYYDKVLRLEPKNTEALTARAISQLASGNKNEGIDRLIDISTSDSGTAADFALISAYFSQRQFDKALSAIDKLEAKIPSKPISANLRGRINLLQGDAVSARKNFERALAIDPTYFLAASSLTQLDFAEGKPEAAEQRLRSLLEKSPNNEEIRLALTRLAINRRGERKEVMDLLTKAVELHPASVSPRLLLIDYLLAKSDTKQAISAAQSAVDAVPHSPELLSALGRAQQVSGDLQQAIRTYSKVTDMQPLAPAPLIYLAEAQFADKNTAAAKRHLEKALELKPDFLDAQRRLLALAITERNFTEALKIAQSIQKQRPNSTIGVFLEADVRIAQKDWDMAIGALRSGLKRSDSTDLAIKLHATLRSAEKAGEADKLAAEWSIRHPKDGVFIAYLAGIALNQKNYPEAEQKYLALLDIDPKNAVALNNIAWVTHQLGKKEALGYVEKALEISPKQPEFMDTLANILADKNKFERAVAIMTEVIALQPGNNEFRMNLAKIYIKSGDKAKAKEELEILSKLGEKYPAHAEVSVMIKSL